MEDTEKVLVETALWDAFFANRNETTKNNIIVHYLHLVQRISKKMHQRLSNQVSEEELASYGVDGLYQAIDNYDRKKKNKFETFASYRIRGAILDAIRKMDWIPR